MSGENALLVTPVEKELAALVEYFASEGYAAEKREDRIPLFSFDDLGLVAGAAGHGKAQLALTTQYLIDTRGPFAGVIVAGAAGALDARLRPGDVVLGTESVEHDYKPRFHGIGPPPRHPNDSVIRRSIVQAGGRPEAFGLHQGPIAGGDEDIVDPARAAALHALTGALCVAWEGAGGARAARFNELPFLEIRAVTDTADADAAGSYRLHLAEAVQNIGRVLLPWLRAR